MAYNRFLGQNGFRGVDFTSHPSLVHPDRLADALNVWKDYRSGQGSAIETFPGYRQLAKVATVEGSPPPKVYGIFRYRIDGVDYILAHIGTSLYYFKQNDISEGVSLTQIGFSLNTGKSSGFQFGNWFYFLDGVGYYRIYKKYKKDDEDDEDDKELGCSTLGDYAYVPTTFINGVEHEQRNMLVDKETQVYGPLSIAGATGGYSFYFGGYDNTAKTCKLIGVKPSEESYETVVIPSTTVKDGEEYKVTQIGAYAFGGMKNISTVVLPQSVVTIGYYAFRDCTKLVTVYFPSHDQARTIEEFAFYGCTSLKRVYVSYGSGEDALTIQYYAFMNNPSDCKIYKYAPSDEESEIIWKNIPQGSDPAVDVEDTEEDPFPSSEIKIPIFSPCVTVEHVFLDNGEDLLSSAMSSISVYSEKDEDDLILYVVLSGADIIGALGKTAKIILGSSPSKFASSNYTPFLSAQSGYAGTAQAAVLGCTICAQFDGRVFFTGNPALPNTVFYTHRDDTGHNNPFYIGTYNYFDTGIGQTPNTAMIATGSNLIVFKGDTIQDGAINLYQGVDGTDNILPRYYVRQQGLAGVGCLGAACNFADDPVFISKRGLDAVGLQTVNLERSVQHRSTNVDRKLTSEDLANAQMTEWEGYLVLLVPGGRVYLADSRQLFTNSAGYMEYEWYFLDDIGAYENDTEAFAFSSVAVDGYDLHPSPDTLVSVDRLDYIVSTGVVGVWYLPDGDKNYLVYKTGERVCKNQEGVNYFSPASCIVGFDEHLIFGTENGAICVFNTDKRGDMPADAEYMGIREDDYKAKYADIIPRKYFTHMGHRYLSAVYLAQENAGVPHMVKNTVKRSAVLKAKDIFGSVFKWNVKTDRQPFGEVAEIVTAMPDLSSVEFGAFLFDTSYDGSIISINEKRKRYVEKQYAFFSDGYCRPFGIYHISYQYEIQGKVKNR